jgi:catechol 2,3-dioxygenase-like lactoylglutathione lyase family enzyme
MSTGQFRLIYNSARYDETVAFYRDGLELPLGEAWDEGLEARGSVFQAASGLIEVMAHPTTEAEQWVVYPPKLPAGVSLAFEVEDVDEWYQRARAKQLPIKTELADFNWGQRGFALIEPNGLVVFIYKPLPIR